MGGSHGGGSGHPEWAGDERFAVNAARMEHRSELVDLIESVTATEPAAVVDAAERRRSAVGARARPCRRLRTPAG